MESGEHASAEPQKEHRMIFAEANNAFTGELVYGAAAIIGLLIGIGSYFATRREVDSIVNRVEKMEEAVGGMDAKLAQAQIELIANGERRSTSIHRRLDPLVENIASIKGSQEAFVKSFDNFTEIIREINVKEQSNHRENT